jgi:integrase/recombinase XerD
MQSTFSRTGIRVVELIRKGPLPQPTEVPLALREAAAVALAMTLREPRPAGFPLLFTSDYKLIEPAVAFLHEHAVQRARTADTVRTYSEILYDWFDTLEQNGIPWSEADAVDLVAYRNRMLSQSSPHTRRPYSIATINLRVRAVLRFYSWATRAGWLSTSALARCRSDYAVSHRHGPFQGYSSNPDRFFVLRQYEGLPRPLTSAQARELLAWLIPPYDLMARWQLYTGLRIGEVLSLTLDHIARHDAAARSASPPAQYLIEVMRKGRKKGSVFATASLMDETLGYVQVYRKAWIQRATRDGRFAERHALFINNRGAAVKKNTYQHVLVRASTACGFKVTSHTLRATFACWLLARLEQLAKQGAAINPLLIVKILMGHQHASTTDRYLRAIVMDSCVLTDILESLLTEEHP